MCAHFSVVPFAMSHSPVRKHIDSRSIARDSPKAGICRAQAFQELGIGIGGHELRTVSNKGGRVDILTGHWLAHSRTKSDIFLLCCRFQLLAFVFISGNNETTNLLWVVGIFGLASLAESH
jgi:hypothetical protein